MIGFRFVKKTRTFIPFTHCFTAVALPLRLGSARHSRPQPHRITARRRRIALSSATTPPAYPSRRLLHLVSDRIASQRIIHLGGRPRRRKKKEEERPQPAGYYKTWAAPNTPPYPFTSRYAPRYISDRSSSRPGRLFLAAFSYHPPSFRVPRQCWPTQVHFPRINRLDTNDISSHLRRSSGSCLESHPHVMYPSQHSAMAAPQKPETFMLSTEAQQALPHDAQVALQQVDNRKSTPPPLPPASILHC